MTEPIIAQREVTRHILNRFGIRTQKKLGQHFLVDESVVRRIADSLELQPGMPVLEIGPGIGTLTQFLAMTGAQVTAVELDRRCIEIMGTTLKAYDNIRIVPGDVLTLDMAEVMGTAPFHIAGNLPYYITTPIVMKILEGQVPAAKMVFMVQKEVADRMAAGCGFRSDSVHETNAAASGRSLGETVFPGGAGGIRTTKENVGELAAGKWIRQGRSGRYAAGYRHQGRAAGRNPVAGRICRIEPQLCAEPERRGVG